MSFVFMVLHWPEEAHREELAHSMRDMGAALLSMPGCVSVGPPYLTQDADCLVGISKWESKEAFLASGIMLRPPDEIVEGEIRPRHRFLLEEVDGERS